MVWRGVLSCRCFAGLIPIGFGLVCVRNWNWMGIFIATDGALTEIFGLVQMEQKFRFMPTGSEEEDPDQ